MTFTNIYGVGSGYRLWVTDPGDVLIWSRDFWVPNSNGTETLYIQDESGRNESLRMGQTYTLHFQMYGPGVCCGAFSTYQLALSGDLVFTSIQECEEPCRTVSEFYPPGNLAAQTFDFEIDESGTSCPVLVDPVGDRTNREGVPIPVDDLRSLAVEGRVVRGIAADGVTRVVLRIPVSLPLPGQDTPIRLRVLQEDGAPSSDTAAEGGLATLRAAADDEFRSDLALGPGDVHLVVADNRYFALALFKAPADFVRGTTCPATDPCASDLTRQIHIEVARGGGDAFSFPIVIARPPVVLVHGVNSEASEWATFLNWVPNRLVSIWNSPFITYTAHYGDEVRNLEEVSPDYFLNLNPLELVRDSSLGLEHNAPFVARSIQQAISDYRSSSNNHLGEPLAVVQADVVAHSMGGLVTRMVPRMGLNTFAHDGNYGQGTIHKVVTLGTPHFATPNGRQILLPLNRCPARIMALAGTLFLESAVVNGVARNGGAFDLAQGEGLAPNPSPVWETLRQPGAAPLYISPIAGLATPEQYEAMWDSTNRDVFLVGCFLQTNEPGPDNLITNYTPEGWRIMLGGESDGVVPVPSALAGQGCVLPAGLPPLKDCVRTSDPSNPTTAPNTFPVVHSEGVIKLGLAGPHLLNDAAVRNRVIDLLNTPRASPVYVLFR